MGPRKTGQAAPKVAANFVLRSIDAVIMDVMAIFPLVRGWHLAHY